MTVTIKKGYVQISGTFRTYIISFKFITPPINVTTFQYTTNNKTATLFILIHLHIHKLRGRRRMARTPRKKQERDGNAKNKRTKLSNHSIKLKYF